ncbi:MAG: adenine phosphoribosyltransferase [Planctomycetota bacterium]
MKELYRLVRDIPDYPKPGILFRDITPLLADAEALAQSVEAMAAPFADQKVDFVAAAEARGFIFGTSVAQTLGAGFVPIRKPGKLPHTVHRQSYDLEYGTDELQVHTDALPSGSRVLIVDDLLATGGTVAACVDLVRRCDAEVVGCSFLIHLVPLGGHLRLSPHRIETVLKYDGDDHESELSPSNRSGIDR